MNAANGIRMKNPAHRRVREERDRRCPGALGDECRPGAWASPGPPFRRCWNERAPLSPEMALRIEKAFGVSMDTLMRMQNSYDIAQARRRAGQIKVARFRKVA